MLLGFFTEEAYDRLLGAVDENKDKYLEPDNWVASYFGPGVEWCGVSSQQVNKFIKLNFIYSRKIKKILLSIPCESTEFVFCELVYFFWSKCFKTVKSG